MPHGPGYSGSCRVPHGSVGILISCYHGHERVVARDVHALLDEELNETNAVATTTTTTTTTMKKKSGAGEDADASDTATAMPHEQTAHDNDVVEKKADPGDELEAELRALKRARTNNDRGTASARFQLSELETGVRGLAFIRVHCDEGEAVAYAAVLSVITRALRKAAETRRCFSKKVMKILPVASTCFASAESLRRCAREALQRGSDGSATTDVSKTSTSSDACPQLSIVPEELDDAGLQVENGTKEEKQDTKEEAGKEKEEEKEATTTKEDEAEDKTKPTRIRAKGTGASFGVIYEHRGGSITRDIVIENTAKLLEGMTRAVPPDTHTHTQRETHRQIHTQTHTYTLAFGVVTIGSTMQTAWELTMESPFICCMYDYHSLVQRACTR